MQFHRQWDERPAAPQAPAAPTTSGCVLSPRCSGTRHTARVDVRYTVQADSLEACAAALARLCAALGAVQTMRPIRPPGGDRWIARAAPEHTPPPTPGQAVQ